MPSLRPVYDFKGKNINNKKNRDKKNKNHNKAFRVDTTDSSSDSEYETKNKTGKAQNGVSCNGNNIYFQTGVSDKSVSALIRIINQKNNDFKELLQNKLIGTADPAPLWLHITSYGGDLFACFRAIDAITSSLIPIYTVIAGYAASAGTLMSVVGKKRFMTPNSYMLIHQLSSGAIGTFWQIKDEFNNLDMIMDDIYDIYLKHSKISRKDLESFLSHDLWFKTDKCIEYGLVDEVFV